MTGNQIAYWTLQENKRANLVNEGIKTDTLNETKRSNFRNEFLKEKDIDSQIKRREVQNTSDMLKSIDNGVNTGIKLVGLFN